MIRTHASEVLVESARRDAQQMLHISVVALRAALEEVERQASEPIGCARCFYVRGDVNPAVTVMNGWALCSDHLGTHHDSRTIVMEEQR